MIRGFKFFHGTIEKKLTAVWTPQIEGFLNDHNAIIDTEEELTRLLSEQISREIDNDIVEELTRRINSGEPSPFEGPIERLNDNYDYFNRWLDIGGNNRA